MQIFGDVTVSLPYSLDYCAKGPDVSPLSIVRDGVEVTIFFPPSMSEGTVGQSFFSSGWAWWTGNTLRLTSSFIIASEFDVEVVRHQLLSVSNDVLGKFLAAYRSQFYKPQIYPVVIDPKDYSLTLIHDDGSVEALPEPKAAFFYNRIPRDAPLETSINVDTLDLLREGVTTEGCGSPDSQLELDADWFESLGDAARAHRIRQLLSREKS
jgi:hypothetical protein